MRFRRMLTCLRLWKAGGIALAAVAWRRTGEGRWQPFELEATGAARGEPWILIDGEEAELGQFVEAIEGVSRGGSVAWALSRFEMGCGRRLESEALSDYLLALRALVESNGDTGRSSLALRVAVLCAEESERKRVQRRVELAQALERFVMGDGPEDPYLDSVGSDSPAHARRRGGAPPARPAARRDVRLSGCRSAGGGRRAAACRPRAVRDRGLRRQDVRRQVVRRGRRLAAAVWRPCARAEPVSRPSLSRPSSTTTPPASRRLSSFRLSGR